eukprot:1726544-Pyramimonas_sp.AAC.1
MITPSPNHFPAPTRPCLQTDTSRPSVVVGSARRRARRARSSRARLSMTLQAFAAARRLSSAR